VAGVKQLIARIDEDLHRKLKERAKIEGRSVNAIVVEALQSKVVTNERELVRAKLRAAGLLDEPGPASLNPVDRLAAIESTRGLGRAVSEALEAEREEGWG
jgi:plasmid stability protein